MSKEEDIGRLTVANLKLMQANNPLIKTLYKQLLVSDYDSFVDYIEEELAGCIQQLECNPEQHNKKSEDEITISIRDMLVVKGIDAEHDVQHGGHVDLFIKQGSWVYVVEAKIYSGNAYNAQGWLQLTTRYASGNPCNRGGILFYLQNHDQTLTRMQGWKTSLENSGITGISVSFCVINPLVLISTHTLARTGLPYNVRHFPVSLYFKPLDKSGLNSAKYK